MKMSELYKRLPGLALAAILPLLLLRPALAASEQEKNAVPASKKTAEYLGSDTCATCGVRATITYT